MYINLFSFIPLIKYFNTLSIIGIMMMYKIRKISCDIDGILTNYPQCWLDFIELETGIKYPSIDEAKKKELNYEIIKDTYRKSFFKNNLPINPYGLELLVRIQRIGFLIIMATSRPIDDPDYPELKQLTYNWLIKNDIPFDDLVYKNENVDFIDIIGPISYHIDDDLKYAKAMEKRGITTFIYNQYLNNEIISAKQKIIVVPTLINILNHLK
jgi:uncharacterized HAD superfamily protein